MNPYRPRNPRSIATVSLSGTLLDKMEAASRIGFDAIEIFESDLLTWGETPAMIRQAAEDIGLTIALYQPFRDFEAMPEPQSRSRRAQIRCHAGAWYRSGAGVFQRPAGCDR